MYFNNIELFVYLIGNMFRIFLISRIFAIFLDTSTRAGFGILRKALYAAYFVVNSGAFILLTLPPSIIFATNLIFILLIGMTFRGSIKNKTICIVSSITFPTICEDAIYYVLILLSVKNILVIGIICSNLLLNLVIYALSKFIKKYEQGNVSLSEWTAGMLIPVFTLFISMAVLSKCDDELVVAIGETSLLCANFLILFLLDRIQQMYLEKLNMELIKQQNSAYETEAALIKDSYDRITALRHDMKNHLLAINQIAKQSSCIQVQDYIKELTNDIRNEREFANTGNYLIDGLLNIKLNKISELGTDIKINLAISRGLAVNPKDLSVILGNVLDNAYEALSKCKGTRILNIDVHEAKGILIMNIGNTYEGKLKPNGTLYCTTKADVPGHGIGLRNVSKVIEKYNGDMITRTDDNYFWIDVMLYV